MLSKIFLIILSLTSAIFACDGNNWIISQHNSYISVFSTERADLGPVRIPEKIAGSNYNLITADNNKFTLTNVRNNIGILYTVSNQIDNENSLHKIQENTRAYENLEEFFLTKDEKSVTYGYFNGKTLLVNYFRLINSRMVGVHLTSKRKHQMNLLREALDDIIQQFSIYNGD